MPFARRDRTIVLAYHAVSATWPAPLSVTPGALHRQLESLRSRGYRGVTFSEAVAGRADGRRVAVTFDDGYRSVIEHALPILSQHGFIATLFVPTNFIGTGEPMRWPGIDHWIGGPHEQELVPLEWDEVAALAEAGWEIGSHTCAHPRLTTLADEPLARELAASRAKVAERLGTPCHSVSYPYGDHDARVVRAAGSAGYAAGCTLPHRPHRATPLRWPRVGIFHDDGALPFRLKTSPLIQGLRATRR